MGFGKSSDPDNIIAGIIAGLRLWGGSRRKFRIVQKHSFLVANGDDGRIKQTWKCLL